jgi:endonuclease/exonuclease/phosphatase family metal-dependent hydrolase
MLCGLWVFLLGLSSLPSATAEDSRSTAAELRVLSWNIWHGGKEDGEQAGVDKTIEVIRQSGADLIALQETYGSGERISEALGFHFLPRGTNVSLLSRYPIEENISVFEEFKCVGAVVKLPTGQRVAVYSLWLPYAKEIWQAGTRDTEDVAGMVAACAPSARDLKAIRDAIARRLSADKYRGVPVVIAGDFNSMSHLDYSEVAVDQYDAVVDWPTSRVLMDVGFRDAYRECHPHIDRNRDRTWTPRFPDQQQDRIDFVYYRGAMLRASGARVIDEHPQGFPSDHAAVLAEFDLVSPPETPSETALRVVSYNIKHCQGMDQQVDLPRTAAALRKLEPDLVGLQEVDLRATRSGGQNQAALLGEELGMHAAFGAFMDFQGGKYGLALLSRYPFRRVESIRLPDGNEPRVALHAEVMLPTDEVLDVINLHFDWVGDDQFRYAQATALAERIAKLNGPLVILGDFNDQPGSRTLELFHSLAQEADKPAADRFTYSSRAPRSEIDFIFTAPASRWQNLETRVIDDPLTSDHRSVLSELNLTGQRHFGSAERR